MYKRQDLLQADIDRMIDDTEDSEGLIKLFTEFDNDPRSIAECISRPYLTDVKLAEIYGRQQQFQEPIRTKAEKELKQYLLTGNEHVTSAQIRDVNYVLDDDTNGVEKVKGMSFVEDMNVRKLKKGEFENFRTSLNLSENKQNYIYQHVYERTPKTIKLKLFSWPKRTLHNWLNSMPDEVITDHRLNDSFNLSKLDQLKSASGNNSSIAGNWESKYNIPTGRVGHTAVWTGTEMIVFGGVKSRDIDSGLVVGMNQILSLIHI